MDFKQLPFKRIWFFVVELLLVTQIAFSQDWTWQHPHPQGNTIWKCSFPSDSIGFAVGEAGTILYTNNQGATWSVQYEGITEHLRDIWAVNATTAWLVGDDGVIFKTTDAGDHWISQSSYSTLTLNGVTFADQQSGWICGDGKTILRTTNGGQTWNVQSVPSPGVVSDLTGIFCVSSLQAWCVGVGGIILHTTNGGTTWSLQAKLTTNISRIRMLDLLNGYVVGDNGLIYKTVNGGAAWNAVPSPKIIGLYDVSLLSMSDIWVGGDNGNLWHTTSAGASWSNESLNTYANINAIAAKNGVVNVFGEYGLTAKKNNAWSIMNDGQSRTANWVSFSDSLHGIVCGRYGLILQTSDGGTTWSNVNNGIFQYSYYGAKAKGSSAWIVGDLGWMYRSTDSGTTWQVQSPTTGNTLFSVDFVDTQNGWAVGDGGTILHTTDGGLHWAIQNSGTSAVFYGVKFTSRTDGWIVGNAGTLLRTTTGGTTWNRMTTTAIAASDTLFNIEFPTPTLGFIAGMNGTLLRSTDGGLQWTKQVVPTTRNLWIVKGQSASAIWCSADSGLVLFSSDGGTTWNDASSNTSFDMFGLDVIGNNSAIVVGDNGTIVKNTILTTISVKENPFLVRSFTLSQNYPNPFNPTTMISFILPYRSYVTLKVFDLLGKEVAVIISEELAAGNYSRPWNAERHASGVYFYRLSAAPTNGRDGPTGAYTETKKLVLLR